MLCRCGEAAGVGTPTSERVGPERVETLEYCAQRKNLGVSTLRVTYLKRQFPKPRASTTLQFTVRVIHHPLDIRVRTFIEDLPILAIYLGLDKMPPSIVIRFIAFELSDICTIAVHETLL